jgi:hypothetical protein
LATSIDIYCVALKSIEFNDSCSAKDAGSQVIKWLGVHEDVSYFSPLVILNLSCQLISPERLSIATVGLRDSSCGWYENSPPLTMAKETDCATAPAALNV